jgi:hypothetical protein
MTDPQPAATTSDLGVVDPIRIPGAARAQRLWASLPQVSRIFVVLAVVDIVVRGLGLFGTSLFIEIVAPLTWITAFLPHTALILLPAVIAARRPGAAAALPLVVQGAIVVALVELLKDPVGNAFSGIVVDQILAPVLVAMAGAIATAVGWVAIARGMRAFTPPPPPDAIAGLAGFVAGGLAIGAFVSAASAILLGQIDLGDPAWNTLLRLNNAVVALSGLGLAYLAWVVIRGTVDPDRPARATKLASASLVALAIGTILVWFGGQGPIWLAVFLITHTGAWTGLVVAFGLGLADPPGTAAATETELDDAPSWPEAGDPSSWPQSEPGPSH